MNLTKSFLTINGRRTYVESFRSIPEQQMLFSVSRTEIRFFWSLLQGPAAFEATLLCETPHGSPLLQLTFRAIVLDAYDETVRMRIIGPINKSVAV